jgi:hypothetical protein
MKYCGKDINIVEAFELFSNCHKGETSDSLRAWFLKALAELKYCGILSASRSQTFVFRKNFFGKPLFLNLK